MGSHGRVGRSMLVWRLRLNGFLGVADTMAAGVWVTGPSGDTCYMNRRMMELVGLGDGEVAPAAAAALDGESLKKFRATIDAQRSGATWSRGFVALARPAGEGLHVKVSSSRLPGSAYRGSVHVVTDASVVERSESAMEDAMAMAAHDLRGPLASVVADARAAGSLGVTPEAASKLASIQATVMRLGLFVGAVLDASQVRSGGLTLARSRVDLCRVVKEAVAQLSADADRARASVSVECDGEAVGQWDEPRIWQVVTNLVSNAIKYGGGEASVSVECDGRKAILSVADGGRGIDPADRQRIFEKGSRLTWADPHPGSGLGLWIVRSLVEAHGGSVSVSAGPRGGSVFLVELPVRPPGT